MYTEKVDKKYLEILQKMSGEERLRIGFELYELARNLVKASILNRCPGISDEEIEIKLEETDVAVMQEDILVHVQSDSLDMKYLRKWCAELSALNLFIQLQPEA